jgi:hypothetical protein
MKWSVREGVSYSVALTFHRRILEEFTEVVHFRIDENREATAHSKLPCKRSRADDAESRFHGRPGAAGGGVARLANKNTLEKKLAQRILILLLKKYIYPSIFGSMLASTGG